MRCWVLWLLLWLAAVPSAVRAQINVEPTYPAYTQIKIDAGPHPGAGAFRSVIWEFTPTVSGAALPDGQYWFTGRPGLYEVRASVVTGTIEGDKVTLDPGPDAHRLHLATFEILADGSPDPAPNPTPPGPDPPEPIPVPPDDDDQPPGPAPSMEGSAVLIFEESAQRTNATAVLIANATYWQTVIRRGMGWRIYDIDAAAAANYADRIRAIGLPALVIIDETGKVLYADRLDPRPAAIDQAIGQVFGNE